MGMDIQSLAPTPDPTQVVVWDEPGPTSDAVIRPGAGADLDLHNDNDARRVHIPADDLGVTIGTATPLVDATIMGIGALNWYASASSLLGRTASGNVFNITGTAVSASLGRWTFDTHPRLFMYAGAAVDLRWQWTVGDLLAAPAGAPGDNNANVSPTITLRQVIDPLGAPVAQNVDAVNQHMNIAIGAGGVAQTLWQFRINGVQGLGIFWDEATGQCALEVPAWNTAITPPVRNGQFVFDVLNPAGFSFFGSKAGAWVGIV